MLESEMQGSTETLPEIYEIPYKEHVRPIDEEAFRIGIARIASRYEEGLQREKKYRARRDFEAWKKTPEGVNLITSVESEQGEEIMALNGFGQGHLLLMIEQRVKKRIGK